MGLFKQPLIVIYDAECDFCVSAAGRLRALDALGGMELIKIKDRAALERKGLGHLEENELLKDMHVVRGKDVFRGYEGYRALAHRLPLLWLPLPFLYIWPVTAIGRSVYRRVADSRTCSLR